MASRLVDKVQNRGTIAWNQVFGGLEALSGHQAWLVGYISIVHHKRKITGYFITQLIQSTGRNSMSKFKFFNFLFPKWNFIFGKLLSTFLPSRCHLALPKSYGRKATSIRSKNRLKLDFRMIYRCCYIQSWCDIIIWTFSPIRATSTAFAPVVQMRDAKPNVSGIK